MDKSAIKKYAIWARRELIERVTQKAEQYEIKADKITPADADGIYGRLLTDTEKKQRQVLIKKIQADGFEQMMEEVACTWFNRFCALRFMEVNGYLPTHVRIFTDEENQFKPQILSEAINLDLDGLDIDKVYELKNENKTEELYKYLLIVQCNALSAILPRMFQKIEDYTELLLPDYLLREGSVIERMIAMIPEEDWTDQVQIIGWLYQYYNTEPKDAVFAALKKNIKISKENIPAATQLFTPDWIVRYMVENSLGRLWLEGHPNDDLKSEWKYYLDEAEQEEDVQKQLDEIHKEYAKLKPEDIRCIDPCMGSGHILCYMFDVLVKIYEDYGYTVREAVGNIVEKNLWGLDIDERAAQLSYFAVMMKARQYDRRFFSRNIQSNVYSPKGYAEGEEFGSLLIVDGLEPMPQEEGQMSLFDEGRMNRWNFRRALAQKYDVVCTNPPYMGGSNMSSTLLKLLKEGYDEAKGDIYAVFIQRVMNMLKPAGFEAMVTMHTWMFISSFEKFRRNVLKRNIINVAHHGSKAFENDVGTIVQTVSFVIRSCRIPNYLASYERLTEYGNSNAKKEALRTKACDFFEQKNEVFELIPGGNLSYWLDEHLLNAFLNESIETVALSDGQTKTGDNDKYLRRLWEVTPDKIGKNKKWVFIAKGGSFRKWYGNIDTVIDWSETARKHYRADHVARIAPEYIWFKHGFVFNHIAESEKFAVREIDTNTLFETAAPAIFVDDDKKLFYVMGYLNTWIAREVIIAFNPTFNTNVRDITAQPIIWASQEEMDIVNSHVRECIKISKDEWDSFETSADFLEHPLLKINANRISDAEEQWKRICELRNEMIQNQELWINDFFTRQYNLVDSKMNKNINYARLYDADPQKDIRTLISYAVGCMFGRYSLDIPGLVYAGGDFDTKYCRWISQFGANADEEIDENGQLINDGWAGCTMWRYDGVRKDGHWIKASFAPDTDNVIPISDDEYFENDIVKRFEDFIRIVYGAETLNDNLKFIADALGGKGQPREVIRNYFLNDFYNDHCKIYQKRPIYWLFDSGKKNGFKCLIYMHRYQPDTIARIRTDYVHEQQGRYRTATENLEKRIASAAASERVKLNKQLTELQAQATEIREYEEKIHHLADQMINIDLDDGVKVNYAKFQDVLAKIK